MLKKKKYSISKNWSRELNKHCSKENTQMAKRHMKRCVRKHLTGGFLCAVLDLSGILCSLLNPEYSRIKRRGKPLLGAEESRHFLCQFFYMVISTLFLFMNHMVKVTTTLSLSFIWMISCFLLSFDFISAENSYLVRQYKYLHNVE